MEAHRQQGTLEGLSRFLVQHERCGAGFDVAHPAGLGSGRVSITCRGCGARHEYVSAQIETERPPETPRPRAPSPPRRPSAPPAAEPGRPPREPARAEAAAPAPPTLPGRARPTPARGRERAGAAVLGSLRRSPRLTMLLLVLAAAALGFAVVRLINEDGGRQTGATAPPPAQAPEPAPPPSAAPTPVPEPPAEQPGPAPPPGTRTLRTERFTIEVPRGWAERTTAGGLLLRPSGGGRVNVQIYFERSPRLSAARMARQTRAYLARTVPGARLFRDRVPIDGRRALELTARGPGETAVAVNVLRGPHRYLLVRRIFAGAKLRVSVAAGRIVRSFEPR